MSDKRISQLVERVTIANNDVLPIVALNAATTNKVTISTIQDWMQTNLNMGVTSVALTLPTGLSVTGSPITSTGTFVVSFTAGYSIPTTAKQTQWDTAYTNRITSATAPLGIASNVISITQSGASTDGYLSSTDWNTFNNKQSTITTGNLTEATSSVLTITGGTGAVLGSGTSIQVKQASGSQDGFLDSADWTTFNNKQNALSGTGIVKSTGGTITYLTDNTSNWDSAYNDKINSAAVTGTTTKTLTLTQQDGGTITTTWTDLDTGTVTSVGVSMPSAFSVANSPITSSGTIAITGAGTISQYIDGTGALQTFPSGLPPTGAAGGDLTGTYPNPTVHAVHGIDFQNGTPTADDTWVYGGSPAKWQHQKLHTNQITEDGNLFYTDARARASISESVTGLDYNSTTGVFSTTAGYGIPTTASQTNWDAAYNDKINSAAVSGTTTKTLTLTQQDGGTITASWTDINTDAVSSVFGRTGAVVATNGDYNTDQVTEGTSNLYFTNARSRSSITLTTTGTSGAATYNSTTGVLNIPSYVGGVTSVNTLTGAVVLTTDNIGEGTTNLYYTDARARAAITGTSPISVTAGVVSIQAADATHNGYLSSTDWTTFNNKQNALTNPITGTGVAGRVAYYDGANSLTSSSSLLFDGSALGIGITPVYKLHVYSGGNTGATSALIRGQYYGATIQTDSILSTYYALNVINGSGTSVIEARADNKVGIGGAANAYTLYVHGTGLYEGDVQISADNPQFITNAPALAGFAGGLSTRINGVEKARYAWNTSIGAYIFDKSGVGTSFINSLENTTLKIEDIGRVLLQGLSSNTDRLVVYGNNNYWTTLLTGGQTSGQSYGLRINAGSTSADIALRVKNYDSTASLFEVRGDSHTSIGKAPSSYMLDVADTINSDGGFDSQSGYFRVYRSGVYYGGIGISDWAFSADTAKDIAIIAKNQFKVGTNNSSASFIIDTNGRVGINTTSFLYRLNIQGDTGSWSSRVRNGNGTDYAEVYTSYGNGQHGIAIDTTSASSGYIFKAMAGTGGGGSGSVPVIYAQNNQLIGFGNSTPYRLMEVGNGVTTAIDGWAKLVVSGTSGVASGVAIGNKMIYMYADTGLYKLDAYDYGAATALPVSIAGNGGGVRIGSGSMPSGGGTLQVAGNVNITGVFQINGTTIGGGSGSGVTGTGTTGYISKWSSSTSITTSALYDNGSNQVGIGTTSVRYRLDLVTPNVDNQADSIALGVNNGPSTNDGAGYGGGLIWKVNYSGYTKGSAGIFQTAEGNYFRAGIAFFTNDNANTSTDWSEKMRLRDTGQFLINATSSTYGAGSGYNFGMRGTSAQGFIAIARAGQTLDSQGMVLGLDTSNAYLTVRDNINLILQTNNQNRVTILNTGEMQVGSAAVTGGGKLQVSGDVNITGNFKINGNTLTTGIGGSGTDGYIPRFNGSTVILGNSTIQDNGTYATLTSTTYVAAYQNIIWKGSSSAYDFSMGNGGSGMYILSSYAIDLNAPVSQRYGNGYIFQGTSTAYNVLILNYGVTSDTLAILGGINMQTTTSYFKPPSMTQTQRNALVGVPAGGIIFNNSNSHFEGWNGSSWVFIG